MSEEQKKLGERFTLKPPTQNVLHLTEGKAGQNKQQRVDEKTSPLPQNSHKNQEEREEGLCFVHTAVKLNLSAPFSLSPLNKKFLEADAVKRSCGEAVNDSMTNK